MTSACRLRAAHLSSHRDVLKAITPRTDVTCDSSDLIRHLLLRLHLLRHRLLRHHTLRHRLLRPHLLRHYLLQRHLLCHLLFQLNVIDRLLTSQYVKPRA